MTDLHVVRDDVTDTEHEPPVAGVAPVDIVDDMNPVDHVGGQTEKPAEPLTLTVGVLAERGAGEKRVALVPEVARTLVGKGFAVILESGAGEPAWFSDADFSAVGVRIASAAEVLNACDVLVAVNLPSAETLVELRSGQVLIGLLGGLSDRARLAELDARGVHVLSLDLLPRQLSRAQTMDALTSQSSIAGYRAALVAAEAYDEYLPMMITAAGTAKPATLLVLGTGVAGLQAIGTARRLGAQVTGYDVRPEAREEVASLGATFLTTSVSAGASEGGYARGLTPEETAVQQAELASKIAAFSIVITTAQVPGRVPPVLVTEQMLARMAPGSVVLDMAASELGGNVAGSRPGERVVTERGVRIIGAGQLASSMPTGASKAYARNVAAVLAAISAAGSVLLDPEDEVIDALWVRADDAVDADAVNDDAVHTEHTEEESDES